MVGPLRPTPCSRRWRSSWISEICVGSRPTHIGPSTVSMAARVAGKIRWPNDSPQPLTPASVSTRRRARTASRRPRSATVYNHARSAAWGVRRARSVSVQVRGLGVRVRRFERPDDPTATLVGEVHLHQLALSQLVEYLGVGGAK